jgi:hypothetical protein
MQFILKRCPIGILSNSSESNSGVNVFVSSYKEIPYIKLKLDHEVLREQHWTTNEWYFTTSCLMKNGYKRHVIKVGLIFGLLIAGLFFFSHSTDKVLYVTASGFI